MLAKRTNILFEHDLWDRLVVTAKEKGTSVGDLVRDAVRKVYFSNDVDNDILEAVNHIKKIRKVFPGIINYKELINAGRKY